MSIRAVIFDLGGVIVRTEYPDLRNRLAERLRLPPEELYRIVFDSQSSIMATLGQISSTAHWESVRLALNLTSQDFATVPREFFAGDVLDTQLVDYLRSLRPAYKTALLSNAWDNLRRIMTEEWKIVDAFDELIISAEVHVAKPDLQIYSLAVQRLGVEPGQAVFVDDVLRNVEAARAAGLAGIHFKSKQQTLKELEEMINGRY